ncbi:MAG: anthranilate phosphoribosyltransferase [Phycisphaerae bacterium]
MREVLLKILTGEPLDNATALEVFENLFEGRYTDAQLGAFLMGLAMRPSTGHGVVGHELAAAAAAMRARSVKVDTHGLGPVLDTCGTGGDVKGTFNISTAAALVCAACGVRVVKHGNRSASSKSGSADVLETLGVNLDAHPAALKRCLREAGVCFAFARGHHPAMKHVAHVRQQMAVPTLFNLLGPLTNPGNAPFQLLGVWRRGFMKPVAEALQALGSRRAWVVHAEDGLDELSTMGPTHVLELKDGKLDCWTLNPPALGIAEARLEDLQVDSPAASAEVIRDVLAGKPGPARDITLLNAAGGLVVAGKAASLEAGLKLADDALAAGLGTQTLEKLVKHSQASRNEA